LATDGMHLNEICIEVTPVAWLAPLWRLSCFPRPMGWPAQACGQPRWFPRPYFLCFGNSGD